MHLPNAARAVVDEAKIRDYLLCPDHRVGKAKARFFGALGFTRDNWPLLRHALLAVARERDAEWGETSIFGQKFVVCGIVQGPAGRSAAIVTAWIVLRGEDVPRLVTAYPGEAQR